MDRLGGFFDFADVEKALQASYAGEVIKPIPRIPSSQGPQIYAAFTGLLAQANQVRDRADAR
jgi:hypothetical protein